MSRVLGSNRSVLRLEPLADRINPVTIRYNFSLDTGGLFDLPEAKAALLRATDDITLKLRDKLAPLSASGGNNFKFTFFNPVTNGMCSSDNPNIGQDELLVYVVSGDIGGNELGLASSGGFSVSGSQQFVDLVRSRGQSGALANPKTDYAPIGGLLAFNNVTNWNFSSGDPASDQFDFESVAHHELLHLLGFGLGDQSFNRNTSGGLFIGPSVLSITGAPAPLDSPNQHFDQETQTDNGTSVMAPILLIGEKRLTGPLEFAALQDIGWEVGDPIPKESLPPPAPPAKNVVMMVATPIGQPKANGNVTVVQLPTLQPTTSELSQGGSSVNQALIVSGPGGTFQVYAGTPDGQVLPSGPLMRPFGDFTGSIRSASADVNGDGVPDLIAATGPGGGSVIRVMDGKTFGDLMTPFSAFEESFTGGVFIAAGDFTGDGKADIVVTPDQGGGGRTKVFDLSGGSPRSVADFFGIDDRNFRGGARAAAGDFNGDGRADLIVSAGFGGGPRVAVFDGTTLAAVPTRLFADRFVFESTLRNGSFVGAGDLNGDGFADLFTAAGPGGAPRLQVLSGAALLAGETAVLANHFLGNSELRSGLRIAVKNLDGDSHADLVTGNGPGSEENVRIHFGSELLAAPGPGLAVNPFFSSNFADGVWVG